MAPPQGNAQLSAAARRKILKAAKAAAHPRNKVSEKELLVLAERRELVLQGERTAAGTAALDRNLFPFARVQRLYAFVVLEMPKGGPSQQGWATVAAQMNDCETRRPQVGRFNAKNCYEKWLQWTKKMAATGNPTMDSSEELRLSDEGAPDGGGGAPKGLLHRVHPLVAHELQAPQAQRSHVNVVKASDAAGARHRLVVAGQERAHVVADGVKDLGRHAQEAKEHEVVAVVAVLAPRGRHGEVALVRAALPHGLHRLPPALLCGLGNANDGVHERVRLRRSKQVVQSKWPRPKVHGP